MHRKIKISRFVGRQLSRLKAGQTYYMIVVSTMTALGIINIAFPQIDTWILIILFPFILFGAFVIGYIMDKSNVTTMDYHKSIEMTQRYLTILDFKNNDFRMLQMEVLFEWMKSLKENNPLDLDILKEKYKEFLKKWNQPKEK